MKTFNFYLEHLFIWAQEKPHLKLLETNTTQTILSLKKKNCNIFASKVVKMFYHVHVEWSQISYSCVF